MIKYGLISETDARVLEKTIDLILASTDEKYIKLVEVGCYGGDSGMGLAEYVFSKHKIPYIVGIDNNKDGEGIRFKYDELVIGNSNEVYNRMPDESQHLIFVDGCHCFAHVVSDFFCYAPKVKRGGYFIFHDTGKHIQPFKDFQHGDKENPDAYISVRKALQNIGLFETHYYGMGMLQEWIGGVGFELIFDEADETDEAGGICVFKKL